MEIHPLNAGFSWEDRPSTGLRALDASRVAAFNAKGYCVLEAALDRATIARLVAEIDPIEREIGRYVITLDDASAIEYAADDMTFAIDLAERCDEVRRVSRSPLFARLTGDLIGGTSRLYWSQAVYKKPEKGRVFPWHQDNGYTFTEPQAYLTAWIALTPATVANGCLQVLPGLHRRGALKHRIGPLGLEIENLPDDAAGETLELAPGDVALLSSLTPHKTGANMTADTRKALILQFAPDGLVRVASDGGRLPQNDPVRNPIVSEG